MTIKFVKTKSSLIPPHLPHCVRLNMAKKKKKNCELLPKGGGGDPKVHNFEILNFGKFQVSKWASGMKRLFKVSFKN